MSDYRIIYHLPGLEITGDSRSEGGGLAKGKHIEPAKDLLLRKLDETYGKDVGEKLKGYMNAFEKNASVNQLSKQEVADTYKHINRILSFPKVPVLPKMRSPCSI